MCESCNAVNGPLSDAQMWQKTMKVSHVCGIYDSFQARRATLTRTTHFLNIIWRVFFPIFSSLFPSLAFPLQLRCQNVAVCWSGLVGKAVRGFLCVWQRHTLRIICVRRINGSLEWGWRPLVSPTNCSTVLGELPRCVGSPSETCRSSRRGAEWNDFATWMCFYLTDATFCQKAVKAANWTQMVECDISLRETYNIHSETFRGVVRWCFNCLLHESNISFSLAAISSTFCLKRIRFYWESHLGQASHVFFFKAEYYCLYSSEASADSIPLLFLWFQVSA